MFFFRPLRGSLGSRKKKKKQMDSILFRFPKTTLLQSRGICRAEPQSGTGCFWSGLGWVVLLIGLGRLADVMGKTPATGRETETVLYRERTDIFPLCSPAAMAEELTDSLLPPRTRQLLVPLGRQTTNTSTWSGFTHVPRKNKGKKNSLAKLEHPPWSQNPAHPIPA